MADIHPEAVWNPGSSCRLFPIWCGSDRILVRWLPAAMLAVALTSVSGCRQEESSSGPAPTAVRRSVTVVVSGDTRGWIIPCGCTSNQSGGLLRRGTFVSQLREQGPVVVLDAGGAADGTAPYQLERFRAILKGESLMGLQAHNVGAVEAAFGADVLRQLESETGVLFVTANVRAADGSPLARNHVLLEEGGQRILVTGVLSPQDAGDGLQVSDPADAILSVAEAEAHDRLIVLAWLPVDELRQLAETLPEADAVVGGPTGQSLPPEKIGPVVLTSATNKGKFLAQLTLPELSDQPVTGVIVEMSPDFIDQRQQQENLTEFRRILAERDFRSDESGLTDPSVLSLASGHQFAGSAACAECHAETNDHWEATGHAHAWDRLKNEGAHVDPSCQQCHTTGYGMEGGFTSIAQSASRVSVHCESCHGPSAEHVADSSRRTPFDAAGICRTCHDPENSPHFEYASFWEKVRHE